MDADAHEPIEEANTPADVSAFWTVKDNGTTSPPVSDDYSTWTVEQLRKECTSRKLRMTRKTSAADRVKHLNDYDAYHHAILEATIDSGTSKAAPRSKHCCIRLLNLLFSDLFAVRFASIGDTPTRQQLDTGDIHSGSSFWRDVTVEFDTNRTDYNKLISPDVRFDGVDASVIVVHDAGSLCDLWKKCNSNYMKAMACFTNSGEHGDDFFDYCGGAVGVFYLRKCLEIKHDLTSFAPAPKRRKSDVVETVQGLLASVMPAEPSMVDELMNMHKLIELVGRRIDDVKAKGLDAEVLQRSADMYRKKLNEMENRFCASK
ncbi:hypothetical protein PF005_g11389 [Phytophthora fragariae]|uniref:Uncharacterized protein n=1 Tax=Phytophthora fragariae TaxID=53985 RepID=A0A6A3Y234_9STRA|nr:hypothetical protein PF007_g11376 [Phytophthora fragariae]KAE9111804.1 hypothetical protein PF010_g10680 [Phytophthora fragariae]KAE9210506.1 hypothetical protein PF005_g11389 [Phytophthora fragariae]KAE9232261.1 hypothetical protein PF002_g12445 [Phytophthora fragariae]KAE9234599.1 hypothetical protein PF004_g9342 [Phytophthora fragariae]